MLPCRDIFAVSDTVLLHRSATSSRRDITVSRNSLACCNARHLRIRRLVQFIFAETVRNNALTNRAALLCRTQRRLNRMCSSTVTELRIGKRKGRTSIGPSLRTEKSSAVLLFEAVAALRFSPDYPKGKGVKIRGWKPWCLPSCTPAGQARFVRFASDYSASIAAPTRPASLPSDAQTISVFRSSPRKVCGKVSRRSGSSSFSP